LENLKKQKVMGIQPRQMRIQPQFTTNSSVTNND